MRRLIAMCLVGVMMAGWAQSGLCDGPIDKFSRGMCNVTSCFFEIVEQSRRVKNEHGSLAGMTYGLGKGVVMMGVRALVGVYEIVTFPVPYPAEYKPILTDPVHFYPMKEEEPVPQQVELNPEPASTP